MAAGKTKSEQAPRLSRAVIAQAARDLADDQGQLPTVRAIASHLGSSPMSLYRHVPDKAVLVQLVVELVYVELGQVELARCTSAHEVLSEIAHHARAVFARHPWFPRQAAATPPLGTSGLDFTERCLEALDAHGCTGQRASTALGAVMTYATGAALLEGSTTEVAGETGSPGHTHQPVDLDAWPHVKAHALRQPEADSVQAGLEALIKSL